MRRLFFGSFIFAALSTGAIAQEYTEGIISSADLFNTSMVEGVSCYRIPALVTAKNGDLIAAIDERVTNCGDLIYNDNINIAVRRSTDNGKTWSGMEIAVDFPKGQSASDPSLVVDQKTGDIFLFYNYMDLENAKGEFRLHYVKSANNGKTWGNSIDITDEITKPEWKNDFKFITSGRGFYTSNGLIVHTLVNIDNGLHLFFSDNHGIDWYLIDTPVKPADESKFIELPDGTWMINSRVNGAGKRYVHTSKDQGDTWESKAEESLIDPSCNASIVRYTDMADGYDKDRLLFVNAASKNGRENLTVRVSYDNGQTWSDGKVIYPGGAAYSSMTILEDGNIAVFFEKDNYTKNEVVVFSLEWMTDGADKYTAPSAKAKKAYKQNH